MSRVSEPVANKSNLHVPVYWTRLSAQEYLVFAYCLSCWRIPGLFHSQAVSQHPQCRTGQFGTGSEKEEYCTHLELHRNLPRSEIKNECPSIHWREPEVALFQFMGFYLNTNSSRMRPMLILSNMEHHFHALSEVIPLETGNLKGKAVSFKVRAAIPLMPMWAGAWYSADSPLFCSCAESHRLSPSSHGWSFILAQNRGSWGPLTSISCQNETASWEEGL